MAWSDQKLKLETKKLEIDERLVAINHDLAKTYDANSTEQATERENDEVLESLAQQCVEELALIDSALTRIEQGSYGQCSQCGNDIGEARLNSQPEAEKCMACA